MKLNPRTISETRNYLDKLLKKQKPLSKQSRPRQGWIKNIRVALGMSSRQLAKFLGQTSAHVLALEKREAQDKITLDTLQRVAQALGCHFIYAIVPPNGVSLESMLNSQARQAAERIIRSTQHSMRLEAQEVSNKITREQIEDLALELKQKNDPRIWSQK